jgi:hypothetical protein
MVAFKMGNTLLTFVDKYYEYDSKREMQDKGFTIGGCVLEKDKAIFDDAIYNGIYQDGGLVIMHGKKSNADIGEWLNTFQKRVNNKVTGYEGLIFTVSIWRGKEEDESKHPKAEIVKSSFFPFLDMKMTWSEEGNLCFGVYLKPGQQLKYLNSIS